MSKKVDKEYINFILEQFEITFDEELYDVYVGFKNDDDKSKYYSAKPQDWETVIDTLLEKGIKLEEYELCSKIKSIKPKILEEAKKRLEYKNE